MKKILLNAFCTVAIVALFSSCLGDSKTTQEFKEEYGYIKAADNGSLCAATSLGYMITSDQINTLTVGRVYNRLEGKVTLSNPHVAESKEYPVYKADNLDVLGTAIKPTNSDLMVRATTEQINRENEIPITGLAVQFFNPDENFSDDVWVFKFKCRAYKSEIETKSNIILEAYLDESYQTAQDGEDNTVNLDNDQAVVNIVVKRENPDYVNPNVEEDKEYYEEEVVVKMGALRDYFNRKLAGSSEFELGKIVFEFRGEDSKNNDEFAESPTRIGSLTDQGARYAMYIDMRQQ